MNNNATFFTRDKDFYKTLLHLQLAIVLQNVITYSVNMADNLMLGNYSQDALSGAATANMIQFIAQTVVTQSTEAAVIIGSQYWSQKKYDSVRSVLWMAMRIVFAAAFWWKWPVVAVVAALNSDQIFKALPVAIRANRYKWVHNLTK